MPEFELKREPAGGARAQGGRGRPAQHLGYEWVIYDGPLAVRRFPDDEEAAARAALAGLRAERATGQPAVPKPPRRR